MNVYVDTNIFMDFLLNRNTGAFTFFMRSLSCEFELVISSLVLFELERHGFTFEAFQKMLGVKLILLGITEADKVCARSLPTHYADALHAAVALRYNVDIFLSQDKGFSFL